LETIAQDGGGRRRRRGGKDGGTASVRAHTYSDAVPCGGGAVLLVQNVAGWRVPGGGGLPVPFNRPWWPRPRGEPRAWWRRR